jgi:hypothetical protein
MKWVSIQFLYCIALVIKILVVVNRAQWTNVLDGKAVRDIPLTALRSITKANVLRPNYCALFQ